MLLLAAAVAAGLWLWQGGWTAHAAWTTNGRPILVFEGERLPEAPVVDRGQVLMPLDAFREKVDAHAYWDAKSALLILTTENRLIVFAENNLTAFVNDEPFRITAPVRLVNGSPYVPLEPLTDVYGLRVQWHAATHTATVDRRSTPLVGGTLLRTEWLRTGAGRFAGRLAELGKGAAVRLFGERDGFYRVRTADGQLGYLPKDAVHFDGIVPVSNGASGDPSGGVIGGGTPSGSGGAAGAAGPSGSDGAAGAANASGHGDAPVQPSYPLDLTWDVVGQGVADPAAYPTMPGVNVVSPTWFYLGDDGLVTSRADTAYIRAAHARGWAVWPLFGNNFDPALSHTVLSDSRLRLNLDRQLLTYAHLYGLDGINIDWENMNVDDRDLFTEFVRELAPLAHEAGLTLSVDVTFPGPSPNWQRCYDRTALGEAADYLILMGYDEFTQGSSDAGPVSGMPWVRTGVADTLQQVPAQKLVLAVPFYTRIWTREGDTWQTRAVGLDATLKAMANGTVEHDDRYDLPYVEWQSKQGKQLMWPETATTLSQRAQLAHASHLAGVASWQRILANDGAWEALVEGWAAGG